MKYISFCSGIEAATVAWESLGWEPLAFCEIEKFPSRVLAHHYPQVPNLGDFTAVDWSQWTGKADVCVGGTPCQAFSVAGLRKSLSDERGNLSLEFIRAVNIIRPRYVVWENVPGVLSTADNAFGCFLAGLVGCEEPIVFEQGWPDAGVVDGPIRTACWRVLDAQYFGLAQRRRRVFVVASAGDGPHPAEILFEWESLRRDFAPRREAREGTARGIEIGPSGGSFTDINPTLDARAKDGPIRNQLAGAVAMYLNGGGMRRNDAESETLLPIPINTQVGLRHEALGERTGLGIGAAGDPASTILRDHHHAIAHALRGEGFDAGEDGTGRGTPLVPVAWDEEINAHEDISGTVTRGGDGGRHAGVAVPVAHSIRGTPAGRSAASSGPGGTGVLAEKCWTLAATEEHCVQKGMAVRRLTPRECERLQGFPDDYTNIPGAADGPRYKALGNSMAVPVMRWIGKRIEEATNAR